MNSERLTALNDIAALATVGATYPELMEYLRDEIRKAEAVQAVSTGLPDCWVVLEDGKIIGTHDAPGHINGNWGIRYVPAQAAQPAQHTAAIKTLEHLGYTYHGAEYWKPPLGKRPAQPEGWKLEFLTDVTTAAGLLGHGKQDKGLAARIGADAMRWRSELFSAAPSTKEQSNAAHD